jgi:hypothetical protein
VLLGVDAKLSKNVPKLSTETTVIFGSSFSDFRKLLTRISRLLHAMPLALSVAFKGMQSKP